MITQRRLDRSVASHRGSAISAFVIAGAEIASVIRRRSISSSIAAGSNSRWSVTVAPAASAGVVRMFSGPVLNNGPLVSTSSAGSRPTAAATFRALKCSISCVITAPFVGPVVPDVLMISSGACGERSGSQPSCGAGASSAGSASNAMTRSPSESPASRAVGASSSSATSSAGSVLASTTSSSGAGIRALSGTRIAPRRAQANSRSSSSGALCPRYATRSPAVSPWPRSAPASRPARSSSSP